MTESFRLSSRIIEEFLSGDYRTPVRISTINAFAASARLAVDDRDTDDHVICGTGTRYSRTGFSNGSDSHACDLLRRSYGNIDNAVTHRCG